jgi:hypothetical protein
MLKQLSSDIFEIVSVPFSIIFETIFFLGEKVPRQTRMESNEGFTLIKVLSRNNLHVLYFDKCKSKYRSRDYLKPEIRSVCSN